LGLGFDATSADVDESILPDENPADYVLRLAESKARASARNAPDFGLVIGSDTAVVDAGEILGKPRDKSDAVSMLKQLRGRTHQVYTAVALYDPENNQVLTELCISDVPMRNYSDADLETYVQSGDPLDKAGAYAIQNAEFHPVESFNGCFASVMGLPLCHVARALKKMGVACDMELPQRCQASLLYECTISDAVLRGENIG